MRAAAVALAVVGFLHLVTAVASLPLVDGAGDAGVVAFTLTIAIVELLLVRRVAAGSDGARVVALLVVGTLLLVDVASLLAVPPSSPLAYVRPAVEGAVVIVLLVVSSARGRATPS